MASRRSCRWRPPSPHAAASRACRPAAIGELAHGADRRARAGGATIAARTIAALAAEALEGLTR